MNSDLKYFMAKQLIERNNSMPLNLSEFKVTSQNGEDGIINECLKRINGDISQGVFVEFGAGIGNENNCIFLADWFNWSGLFIESEENLFINLKTKYNLNKNIHTVKSYVLPENINEILKSANINDVDVFSIDIDGQDYWIWEALEINPKILVIEYNAALEYKKMVMKKGINRLWDGTDGYGASITALQHLGHKKGYSLVYTDMAGVNAFFIRNDFIHLFPESNNPIIHGMNYHLESNFHPHNTEDLFITLN